MPYDAEAIEAMIKADDPNLEALLTLMDKRARRVISVEALVKAINSIAVREVPRECSSWAGALDAIADMIRGIDNENVDMACERLNEIAAKLRDWP